MRREIIVPEVHARRSLLFGERLAAHYKNGGSPASRAVSGNRGTERNPDRLAQGKFGEVALALYFALDPRIAVKWKLEPDNGSDIRLTSGDLLDAKTTFPHYRLIWSNTINHIFQQKHFDYLVSVSMIEGRYDRAWIEGCVEKSEFFARKRIAGSNDGLEPGTWYMPKCELHDELHDVRLLKFPQPARRIICHALKYVRDHSRAA